MSDDAPSIVKQIFSALLGGFLDVVGLGHGRAGFRARSIAFGPSDLDVSLRGKTALITGGNSGLGKAIAIGLAKRGAEVWLLCRDMKRGRAAVDEIRRATKSDLVSPETCDMSSLQSIAEFSRRFPVDQVDILVHNAGAMIPERKMTAEGIEATFATNVVGPFTLTQLLLPKLGASGEAGARVIFVSSGEAYPYKLSLQDIDWSKRPYDAAQAFAMAKRAQIVIAEILDEKLAGMYVHCSSMHPGWVATDGLARSHPKLAGSSLLRSTEQGADTVVWLAASKRAALPQGLHFMDRRVKSPHLRASTLEDPLERGHLYTTCMKLAGSVEQGPAKPKMEFNVAHPKDMRLFDRKIAKGSDIDALPETRKGPSLKDADEEK